MYTCFAHLIEYDEADDVDIDGNDDEEQEGSNIYIYISFGC